MKKFDIWNKVVSSYPRKNWKHCASIFLNKQDFLNFLSSWPTLICTSINDQFYHLPVEHDVYEIFYTVSLSYWAGNDGTFEEKKISFDHQRSKKVFRILISLQRVYCTLMAIMAIPIMTVHTCPKSRNGGYQIWFPPLQWKWRGCAVSFCR